MRQGRLLAAANQGPDPLERLLGVVRLALVRERGPPSPPHPGVAGACRHHRQGSGAGRRQWQQRPPPPPAALQPRRTQAHTPSLPPSLPAGVSDRACCLTLPGAAARPATRPSPPWGSTTSPVGTWVGGTRPPAAAPGAWCARLAWTPRPTHSSWWLAFLHVVRGGLSSPPPAPRDCCCRGARASRPRRVAGLRPGAVHL